MFNLKLKQSNARMARKTFMLGNNSSFWERLVAVIDYIRGFTCNEDFEYIYWYYLLAFSVFGIVSIGLMCCGRISLLNRHSTDEFVA